MELKEILEKTGLSSVEAKLYLVLLKLKNAKAGKIAKEANLNRTTTYDGLKRLLEKGLVGYVVKANVKWFEPTPPERLMHFLKERENSARDILPKLKAIYKKPEEKHNVTLFYGHKGMQTIFHDIIKDGRPNCVMDTECKLLEKMPYFVPYIIKQFEKHNVRIKHIVREGTETNPSKTTETRYISRKFRSNASVNIQGDKVAIIIWSDPPEAVLIRNKQAAQLFKNYFDLLWNIAKKK